MQASFKKLLFNKGNFIASASIFMILLTACATPRTPQQVAQEFWDATIAQNITVIREFTREADLQAAEEQTALWQNATISLGKVHLQNQDAWIDTEVMLTEDKSPMPIKFRTVLIKEDSQWKVDQSQTMSNVETSRKEMTKKESPAEKLVKKLHRLGDQFSKDMDKSTKELKKHLPEIQKEIQALGKNLDKEVNEAWKKFGPTIEENLHEFADAISKAIENAQKKKEQEKKPAPDPTIKSI